MRRRSRAEQSEANRAAILQAARRVFVQSGFHATTVDAIAAEAGMTIGAIYSRFAGKADLFLALLDDEMTERAKQFAAAVTEPPGTSAPRRFARRWATVLRHDLDWQLLVIEFRVHAARNPDLAGRYAALHRRALAVFADAIAAALPFEASPAQIEALARAGWAAGTGAALARVAEGEQFSDDLFEEIAIALAQRFLEVEVT